MRQFEIRIFPWLSVTVMNDFWLLANTHNCFKHLRRQMLFQILAPIKLPLKIPFRRKESNSPLTNRIKNILIYQLRRSYFKQFKKQSVLNIFFKHLFDIHNHNAALKIIPNLLQSQNILGINSIVLSFKFFLFFNKPQHFNIFSGCQKIIAHLNFKQLRNIGANQRITINIKNF